MQLGMVQAAGILLARVKAARTLATAITRELRLSKIDLTGRGR